MKKDNMKSSGQPAPRPLSRITVAHMISLFDFMFQPRRPFGEPRFDITKLPTMLFGMGFEHEFITRCETEYYWNFSSLFPALYDGSFYGTAPYAGSRAQGYLRGFAAILCGVFNGDASAYRTPLYSAFEESLLKDGYKYIDGRLIETGIDTLMPPELAALPDRKFLVQDLSITLQVDEPVAVLFIDLDHFKQVNDQLGHAEGDNCLITVVETLARVLRCKGKLYRVGGDELCVMLPNFSSAEAIALAERVRSSIYALEPFGKSVKVTVSVGVAVSNATDLRAPESLIDAADRAMYVAKFTTKNRVCTWPPDAKQAAEADANRKKAASEKAPGATQQKLG